MDRSLLEALRSELPSRSPLPALPELEGRGMVLQPAGGPAVQRGGQ